MYSGRSESLVGPLVQQFRDDTGLEVNVKYAGTPELAATLLEEGKNSPADVFFAQDPGGLSAVEGLLEKLPESTVALVPEWASSPNGKWVGVSGRARTVVYNTARLTPADLPDDLTGFTGPEWKGRIGWAPSNASFQTMITAMRAVWGEDRTLQWLKDLQANEPKVYPKNTPIVAAAGAGEIDVGFVNHYYLHRFLAEEGESFPARNYHPRAGGARRNSHGGRGGNPRLQRQPGKCAAVYSILAIRRRPGLFCEQHLRVPADRRNIRRSIRSAPGRD